jgi:aminopeptidase N
MRVMMIILLSIAQQVPAQIPGTFAQPVPSLGCAAKATIAAASTPASAADRTVDAIYYRLDLRLNIPASSLTGIVTMRARVITDSTRSLTLDLSASMTVDSVRMADQRLLVTRLPASFSVGLPRSFRAGELVTLVITYHGNPEGTGFGSFNFAAHGATPWVWTLSEPYGARDWWPCRDHPLDKADSVDILVTCPTGYRVGSNGKLLSVVNNGDGTSTHFWAERYPIATYLVSIAVTNFATFSNWFAYSPSDSMEVLNYVLPEHFTLAQQQLPVTVDILRVFSTLFGPYPFLKEKYGHSEFGRGGAMEHQTMTSTITFDEDVIAHELAHQWFGDLITCASWQDLWLNEGFATYSESLHREARYGKAEYRRLINDRLASAKNETESVFRTDTSTVNSLFAVTGVYAKGASVLHMLRHVVGDAAFFRIIAAYAGDPRFRYGTASTSDFRGVCEAVSGRTLGWFFDEWIYGISYPRYSLKWSVATLADTNRVTATISQIPRATQPRLFQMPVDLRFSAGTRDTTVTLFNSTNDETFTLYLQFKPDQGDIDPDTWILRDVVPPEPLIPERAELDQNYPNPFNSGTTITIRIPGRVHGALRIYDVLGRRVATIVDGTLDAGSLTVRWEGKDDSGTPAASGVYFARLETASTTAVRGLLLIR